CYLAHDVANLLNRMAQDISEDYGAALAHWKTHEGPQAGSRNLTIIYRIDGIRDHIQVYIGMSRIMARPSPQKIQRRVVSDTKQPASRIGNRCSLRQRLDRLQERFLDHILPVKHGASHPSTIPVQLWPQLGELPFEIPVCWSRIDHSELVRFRRIGPFRRPTWHTFSPVASTLEDVRDGLKESAKENFFAQVPMALAVRLRVGKVAACGWSRDGARPRCVLSTASNAEDPHACDRNPALTSHLRCRRPGKRLCARQAGGPGPEPEQESENGNDNSCRQRNHDSDQHLHCRTRKPGTVERAPQGGHRDVDKHIGWVHFCQFPQQQGSPTGDHLWAVETCQRHRSHAPKSQNGAVHATHRGSRKDGGGHVRSVLRPPRLTGRACLGRQATMEPPSGVTCRRHSHLSGSRAWYAAPRL